MNLICTYCGNTRHEDGATHCAVCGYELPRESNASIDLLPASHPTPITRSAPNLPQPFSYSIITDQGQRCSFNSGGELIVGSGDGCDFRLYGPDVSWQHARFYQQDGMIFIQILMSSLVFVNGRPLTNLPRQLGPADQIKIGRYVMMIVREDRNHTVTQPRSQDVARSASVTPYPHGTVTEKSDLSGIVRHVDGPYMENPDPNASAALRDIAWVGLTIWKPGLGFLRKPPKQIQVRYYRVQSDSGGIYAVKMKGNIYTGMINIGDHVSFWGHWKGGTLHMTRAYNHTLNTNVEISQR